MNVDITVAHDDDRNGAVAAFVYEDLDRELSHESLLAEAVADVATDYPGFVLESAELDESHPKVLVRVFA